MIYFQLVGLGISFLQQFIPTLTANKVPVEVLTAVQAALTALQAHQTDLLTTANFEAQRG